MQDLTPLPVREAIKRLHSEGLVEILPSRRVRVAELSRAEIEDIYDMRAALEPLAVRLAVPRLTKAQLRDAAHALEAADDEEDADTFGVRNAAFHLSLMNASERTRLLNEIASLLDLSDRYQRAALRHGEHNALVRAEHAALLEAARAGDAEEAARLTEAHCARRRGSAAGALPVRLLLGIAWLWAFLGLGTAAVELLPVPLPGSVAGMLLLWAALEARVVRLEWLERGAGSLLGVLGLLFVPAGVGLVQYGGPIWLVVVPVVAAGALATLAVTGHVVQRWVT